MSLTLHLRRCFTVHSEADHSFQSGHVDFAFWDTAKPSAKLRGSFSHDTELTTAQKVTEAKAIVNNSGDHSGESNYNEEWNSETWDN